MLFREKKKKKNVEPIIRKDNVCVALWVEEHGIA